MMSSGENKFTFSVSPCHGCFGGYTYKTFYFTYIDYFDVLTLYSVLE